MTDFIHLKVHTDYSLVDGLVRIKPLMKRLVALEMPAVAITDQSNLFALVKFYKAAQGAGIKPICGADVWILNPDDERRPFLLTLLVRNQRGYRNLTELISRGYTAGQVQGRVLLHRDWVREASEGLLALSGASAGDVGQALLAEHMEVARERLAFWMETFPDAFYLELQRTFRPGDERCLHLSVELAADTDCPVVATNDVHFLQREDFDAHEARVCIHEGRTLDDPRRERRFSEAQYLKSPAEMAELFRDLPEALENTVEIARRCNLELQLGKPFLPNYPIPAGLTLEEFFIRQAREGLEERLAVLLPASLPDREARKAVYEERLKFELDIIIQMGFPGYFLIVMDFIRWARNNGVPVGPGRGSGAGSLVAYVLGITDLDPLAYDLLFERFLNPERVSMPDFDVDFCMDGRDRVISYVADAYGREAVSQIITFGTMAAKAVVRDVARVQGKPYSLGDRLSKLIPFEVGMTLAKAREQEQPLRDYLDSDEEARDIWEMAVKLEGVTRNVGKHAGGVVIAPTRLTDFAPLYCDAEGGGLVTQFDKDDVEAAGLVKFDFLGLRTLTIVAWAVAMINRRQADQPPLDITRIPLDDPATFELLKHAETTAVFQLESRGMKDLIRRLLPDCFEDIIALVALFRPGPLQSGMVDDFINRKHGRATLSYPHPDYQHACLQPVLQPTYGIILYQEQVMQIAQVMAGYSLGSADLLRRAMGKKKPEEMAKQKEFFMAGAAKNGIDAGLAEKIFELVEKFAGYGFNKSHSAAYALVSYQTAWLKTHYPAPFMAAVLTADMDNTDKVVTLVEECRRMKIEIVLPDVNTSDFTFTVDGQGRIVYGLGAVKGLGEGPVQSLLDARAADGPFTDLFDFCRRVDLRKVNKRALEALIRSGAMDSIGPSRARLMAAIEKAVKEAEQASRSADAGMLDLFGEIAVPVSQDVYAESAGLRDWPEKERLKLEKETLGLYITGHPFDAYEEEVRRLAPQRIQDLKPGRETRKVAGLVVAWRTMKTKRGGTMAIVTLDDRSARIDATLFTDVFDQCRELLHTDRLLIVEGEIEEDEFSGGMRLRARSVTDIGEARRRHVRELRIRLAVEDFASGLHKELDRLLGQHQDGCPVVIHYQGAQASTLLRLGERWRVSPDDDSLQALRHLLGNDRVELCYP